MSKHTPRVMKAARKIDSMQLEWYIDCSTSPAFSNPDQRRLLIATIIDEEIAAEIKQLRSEIEKRLTNGKIRDSYNHRV